MGKIKSYLLLALMILPLGATMGSVNKPKSISDEDVFKCRVEYLGSDGHYIRVTAKTCKEAAEKVKELLAE